MNVVLAATDFSTCSRAAVRLASAVARRRGATLLLLHAVEPVPIDGPALPLGATGWETELLRAAELELARLASELRQSEIAVETRAALGLAAGLVLDVAREVSAELIVLGTHGKRGAANLFLGSVAERVVRASQCPVLVAREGAAVQGRWDGRRSLHLAVAADGTAASEAAFHWIRTAGQSLTAKVSLLRPYWPPQEATRYGIDDPWPGEGGHAELLGLLERDLRRDASALAGASDPPVRFRIASPDAAAGLSQDAQDLGADALVIGVSRHARGLKPVSPVAILRAATLPVFCIPDGIRPHDQRLQRVRSILLACDRSETSRAAILPAYGLLSGGGRVELLYVHELGLPDLIAGGQQGRELAASEREAIESELRAVVPPEAAEHGIATHVSVVEAPFADEAIRGAAERFDVDAIAIGSHGRSGLSRALLGSVAEQVARRSPRPVLIVHARPSNA